MRLAIVITFLVARIAGAQSPSPTNEAEKLFQEGLALFGAGKFDDACAKFDLSIKKNPRALGTLLNLGRCNERRGKVATALALYQEAFDRATESGATAARDTAQERIAVLSAQVPVVVIKRAGPPLAGEKLVVDDKVVASDKAEIQLDPGTHNFVLTAPGRLPFEKSLNITVSSKVTLDLPVLELPKERTVVRREGSTRRTLGKLLVIGGGSVVALAGGLALYAKQNYDKQFANGHCARDMQIDGMPSCDALGQARTERDRRFVTSASIIGVIGAVAVGSGLALWWTAPTERPTVVPTTTANGAGVSIVGRF